ncbi:MAG: phytanoyl-CoA dioxygenase family protein [Woeseiaceae bacterium]
MNIENLLSRAGKVVTTADRKEIVFAGKDFFGSEAAENGYFDLLKQLHLDVWPELSGQFSFTMPVVDHCYLLVKNPGGAVTRMHQDRPYWIRKEAEASIFSVWIALDEISEANGGLILSRQNEVSPDQLSTFNSGSMFEHEEVADSSGSFPLLIPEQVASELAKSMESIGMEKGEAIAFDSFEPHKSSANTTDAPRLAMKIAYAEGQGMTPTHYLTRVDELEQKF